MRSRSPKRSPKRNTPEYSNLPIVKNAVMHTLLKASVLSEQRDAVVQMMAANKSVNIFMLLLDSERRHTFRGLYALEMDVERRVVHLVLLLGEGPEQIQEQEVSRYFKYSCSLKQFQALPMHSFGVSAHAVAIKLSLRPWYSGNDL